MFKKYSPIKTILFISVFVAMALFLSSCMDMTSYWDINEDGDISSVLQVSPDSDGSTYNNDFCAYFQILRVAAPKMFENVLVTSQEVEKGYSDVTQYTLKFGKINVSKLYFPATFKNGKFTLKIPNVLYEQPSDSDLNDVVLTLYVKFPKDIDVANTPYVNENIAKWRITKGMLYNGVTLKAYLK